MNLNFKMSELLYSKTAQEKNVDNSFNYNILNNLLDLIFYCLQPVRNLINKPMIITSGYRSKVLNKLVGGKINSQHIKGQAADFIIKGMKPKEIAKIILQSDIDFDQLINEKNQWIHISFSKNSNRKQFIKIN